MVLKKKDKSNMGKSKKDLRKLKQKQEKEAGIVHKKKEDLTFATW